ncbi:hypothetical protein [Rhizobium herbae]|uniref:YkuD domain-containing protein n=1 Tax=Rhizobium herbae TaxID=508661 RepID=A0ABS4EUE5_9HYPH|nr:hypothetical protein [Rhizobium herbae]MBP1861571.1 hypothetical protein [Rhizobium herbae]
MSDEVKGPVEGWRLNILRHSMHRRGKRVRTIGHYWVSVGGVTRAHLTGTCVECGGPGANAPEGNGRRLAEGEYAIVTHVGAAYSTFGYDDSCDFSVTPKPALGLAGTGDRTEILIHPGIGFLRSVGCINLTKDLEEADMDIDPDDSVRRVIAMLKDLETFCGGRFPGDGATQVPRSSVVIVGEP